MCRLLPNLLLFLLLKRGLGQASTTSATALGWDYDFPYGADNSCQCQRVPALGDYYATEDECLKAYAADPYQWCTYQDTGVYDAQCDHVVTIAEGITNDMCSSMCTSLVAGSLPFNEFSASCKFNFYADFGCEVAVGWQSCFSNYVYGWSDYDPNNQVQQAPLKIFSNVEGPVQCQALCQAVDECVYWTWRAYPDQTESATSFQNPPLTCLLYDQDYIDGVLNTVMPTTDEFAIATPYCNFPEIPECTVDIFNRAYINFFEPYSCLLCGCVGKCAWKSPYHLSGPAFCEPEYREECSYSRPAWTSTLPPCETLTDSTTTIAVESSDEVSTETTIEMEESSTIPGETFPETVGTSMTTITSTVPLENLSTEAALTIGTSTTVAGTAESAATASDSVTADDATVTPVGSIETLGTSTTTVPVSAEMESTMPGALTGSDATVTPVGSIESTQGAYSKLTMGTATTTAGLVGPTDMPEEATVLPVTPPQVVTCPDCPEDNCEDDIVCERDFADDDECIDC